MSNLLVNNITSIESFVRQFVKQRKHTPSDILFAKKALAILSTRLNSPCCTDPNAQINLHTAKQNPLTNVVISALKTDKNIPKVSLIRVGAALERFIDGCCPSVVLDVELRTFAGADIDHYPVGVFDVNQNFIGLANSQAEYISIWNANVNNQAIGQIVGSITSSFKFRLTRTTNSFTGTSVLGMNYFETIQSGSNAVIYTSPNTYIGFGNTLVNSNSAPTVSSDTILNYDFSGVNWHGPFTPFSMKQNTLTGYIGGNKIYVFNNGQSNLVYTPDPFNVTVSLDGDFFNDIQHFSFRSVVSSVPFISGTIDWSKVTNLKSFNILNIGGGSFALQPSDVPVLAPTLENMFLSDFPQVEAFYAITSITASNYPHMKNLLLKSNAGQNFITFNPVWWSNLPKTNQSLIIIGMTFAFALSAAVSDVIWNQLAINLNGIVPSGNKIIQIQDSSAATAASLTARNYLISQGWTVLLT